MDEGRIGEMRQEEFDNWLNKLSNLWEGKDIQKLSELFAEEVEYYESPFSKIDSLSTVINQWEKDLKEQDKINLEITPLLFSDNIGVANWKVSFNINDEKFIYDGVYYLEFNENNLCTVFKQWWVKK